MYKVAVLLAVSNGIPWLKYQLDSLVNQHNVDIDIFVSLDNSFDDSNKLIINYSKNYENIFIINENINFKSASKNFIYLISQLNINNYNFVALSDQDDIWNLNRLNIGCNQLINKDVDGYSTDVNAFWTYRNIYVKKSYEQTKYDYLFESPGPGCTFILTSKLFTHLQDFINDNYSKINLLGDGQHDLFIYAFARSNNYKWYIDNIASIDYRQHSNNYLGVNYGFKAYFLRFKLVINGWAFNQSKFIAKLLYKDDQKIKDNSNIVRALTEKNKINYILLAINYRYCRRRNRDKIIFLLLCILMSIIN
jgi:rhamnosyltransferase